MKKVFLFNIVTMFFLICFYTAASAAELTPAISLSNGSDASSLSDKSYNTGINLNAGDTITVTSSDGSLISGVYIIWDSYVKPYTITTDSETISCGQNGFIHDYVKLNSQSSKAVITIPEGSPRIAYIRIFGDGELPSDVQVWNPPCSKADIALVASHADDDILFLGGIIPTYAVAGDAQIQVIYMSEFWSSAKIREHEKLDGLWTAGLTNYPVCGNFADLFSKDLATAESQYDLDAMVSYLVSEIRRFKPQVIVSHDLNGEYGHGFHMLTAKAVTQAVTAAADASSYTDSAGTYGIWDTPKTYLHLYAENKIILNLRTPINAMGGRTALDIASDAYKQHVSQQWCWFYVSDEYEYSCADFGLYRTTVGNDTGNDLLENIKTYKVQAQEAESMSIAERESIEQASREEQASIEAESLRVMESESASLAEQEEQTSNTQTIFIVLAVVTAALITGVILSRNGGKNNK